jgi:tetratricopeptide (TPR) repeat protein
MNLFKWLFAWRSPRREALSLYRQGLARAESHDLDAAVVAYTAAINLDRAPEDVKAMALYNRALLFAAQGDSRKATADLNAIVAMPIPVRGVTVAARRRLERLQHRQDAAADARSQRKPTS